MKNKDRLYTNDLIKSFYKTNSEDCDAAYAKAVKVISEASQRGEDRTTIHLDKDEKVRLSAYVVRELRLGGFTAFSRCYGADVGW